MRLRDNLRKHVVLKKEEHVNSVPLFGSEDNRGKGKSALRPSPLNAEQDNWKRTDYRSDSNRSRTFRSTAQAREAARTEGTDQQVRDPSLESQRSTINDRDRSAALVVITVHTVIAAHAVIPTHATRAARLVEKERTKAGDKNPHRIVPMSHYRLTQRSYLTAILAVWYPRFRNSTRRHRSAS
jgi:hypothetical protein